jgi:hypothetical protein
MARLARMGPHKNTTHRGLQRMQIRVYKHSCMVVHLHGSVEVVEPSLEQRPRDGRFMNMRTC